MIFSENRRPSSDQVRGQAFSGSCYGSNADARHDGRLSAAAPQTSQSPARTPIRATPSFIGTIRPSTICAAPRAAGCRISPSNIPTAAPARTTPASAQLGGARCGGTGAALRRHAVAAALRGRAVRPPLCGADRHCADGRPGHRLARRRQASCPCGAARAHSLYARARRRRDHRGDRRNRAGRVLVPALSRAGATITPSASISFAAPRRPTATR